ncbi:MAG: response regulator [Candidatus Lokiarchaeota archaeon]|nr:response regulator [Candidatus Lokiarchaeota archaeon]
MATIFLIDDDSSIVTLFDKFLTVLGHEIVAKAYNGEEAVKLFNEFRKTPDLILMDHRMPKKDGLTAAREILSTNNKSKIIFFSADYSIKEKALALGAKYFLEKPFKLDTLVQVINKIISED